MRVFRVLLFIAMTIIVGLFLNQCEQEPTKEMTIIKELFGKLDDGREAYLFTMTNQNGMKVSITNYGGNVTNLFVPDKNGNPGDIILGFDNLEGYVKDNSYIGSTIGRYGNRIANGKFELNGKTIQLPTNSQSHHLHGGEMGFHKVLWDVKAIEGEDRVSVDLNYLSVDGEMGYPGNLNVNVIYSLTKDNKIEIEYHAITDKPTICNLTNHCYFNLKDAGTSTILDHEIMITADKFTPVDSTLIPTGDISKVIGTPFDFTMSKKIGTDINAKHEQLTFGFGYDHNFVVNGEADSMKLAVRLKEPTSGRVLEIYSLEPGIQVYTGNFLNGTTIGKNKTAYDYRTGMCMEPQHYPDSPNQPNFPTTTLNPDEKYYTKTIWKFSTINN